MTFANSRRMAVVAMAVAVTAALALLATLQVSAAGRSSGTYLNVDLGAKLGHIDILRPRGTNDDDQPFLPQAARTGLRQAQAQVALSQYGIQYNGGPVIQQANVVAVYWASAPIYANGPTPGTAGTASADGSLIGYYLRNLGGSPYYSINTSYTNSAGTPISANVTYTGFWADNNNVQTGCANVSDAKMQAELISGFNSGKLTYDPNTIYAIFSAGQVNLGGGFGNCNGNSFQYCAYHTYFNWNGNIVKYAAMPYNDAYQGSCTAFQGGGPAHGSQDPGADAEVNTLTHEIQEANTDPQLDAWWVSNSGSPYFQEENADMCAWTFGTLNPDGRGNITIGGQSWLVQRNWLNTAPSGGCAQSYASGGPTTGTISGRVTRSAGGTGISGATVGISGGTSTTTDGNGNYTLAAIAAGTYTVTASAAGFTNGSSSNVSVTAGSTTTQNFSLVANPTTGTLSGTVTSASGGAAVSGATVQITGGATAQTNASGAYAFSNLAAGTYSLTVSKTGFTNGTASGVVVIGGQTTTRNFSLTAVAGSVPGKPSLTVTKAPVGQKGVRLSWTAPAANGSTITGYRIYRSTSTGTETFLTTTSGTSYSDTSGLTAGSQYFYKVSAVNGVGEGPLSNQDSARAR
jgi:hypothetical protein